VGGVRREEPGVGGGGGGVQGRVRRGGGSGEGGGGGMRGLVSRAGLLQGSEGVRWVPFGSWAIRCGPCHPPSISSGVCCGDWLRC